MDAPVRLDGSKEGPIVTRKIVVWRRLEPGDVRTPGTEIAPESQHLEAKIVEVAISAKTYAEMQRLWKKRDEVTSITTGWSRRYEPAGVLWAIGGSGLIAVALDYLPPEAFWVCTSFAALGVGVGILTRMRKRSAELEAATAWQKTEERRALEQIEKTLTPRWKRFGQTLLERSGFRAEVRVGDIHEADRLVSIDVDRITHPDTWRPDAKPREVRYGWAFTDGRTTEQIAELEDAEPAKAAPVSTEEE